MRVTPAAVAHTPSLMEESHRRTSVTETSPALKSGSATPREPGILELSETQP